MTGSQRSDAEIERSLRSLARSLEVPSAPDYASRVTAALADTAGTPTPQLRWRRRQLRPFRAPRLLIAAALVLLATAVTVAVPASRHALASWFGFSGIDITAASGPASRPPSQPAPLAAGSLASLPTARTATANRLELPADLSRPDRVYLRRDDGAIIVTLGYRTAGRLRPTPDTGFALVITEVFDAGSPLLEKILQTGAQTSMVNVNDARGVFIDGPQEILTLDQTRTRHGSAVVHDVAPRTSANSLIWAGRTGTFRLEGDFTATTALKLARSLR